MILDSGRLRVDERDWAFGNPLTLNDLNAAEYGRERFGHNEGLHGTLTTRFTTSRPRRPAGGQQQLRGDL
jgi:hypothetical protein